MDLKKEYYSEGIKYNILEMVKREPEWAANRLQEGEKHFEELQELRNASRPAVEAELKTNSSICDDGEAGCLRCKVDCRGKL